MQIKDLRLRSCCAMRTSRTCATMRWPSSRRGRQASHVRSPARTSPRTCPSIRGATRTMRVTQVAAPLRSVPVTIIARWVLAAKSTWIIPSLASGIQAVLDKTLSITRSSQEGLSSQVTKRLTRRRCCRSRRSSRNWSWWSMVSSVTTTIRYHLTTKISM